jgi:tRNA threonylcarbamoyladenosine biosynthesis protein TsaE
MTTIESASESDTVTAGRDLGRRLAPGAVVLLEGPLGAGKTAFVRGLAEGLGLAPDAVSSPTFAIVQEYRGEDLTLQHIDLYRLTTVEVDDLALEDLLEGQIAAIEWPDRWTRAPADSVRVSIEVTGDSTRRISIARTENTEPRNPGTPEP